MAIADRNPCDPGYFFGTEVEHSPYEGLKTLFVAGVMPTVEIRNLAIDNGVRQIYLAANQSYAAQALPQWLTQAVELSDKMVVTVDVPISDLNYLSSFAPTLSRHTNVHIMLSIPARGLATIHNFTVKLDDKIPDLVNPGVWCVSKNSLQHHFTPWAAYEGDSKLEGTS
jgi:hypothetical protein